MRLLSLFFLFFLASCDRITEQNQYNSELKNYTSPFRGTWYGNYSGSNINSTFTLTVYKAGNVEVTRNYDNNSETFYGQIYDNGTLNSLYSSTGFYLYGNLSAKYGDLSPRKGTWRQNDFTGNWTLTKK